MIKNELCIKIIRIQLLRKRVYTSASKIRYLILAIGICCEARGGSVLFCYLSGRISAKSRFVEKPFRKILIIKMRFYGDMLLTPVIQHAETGVSRCKNRCASNCGNTHTDIVGKSEIMHSTASVTKSAGTKKDKTRYR